MKKEELNEQLLKHDFAPNDEHGSRYQAAKIVAQHYTLAENAIAVLSNMEQDISYICYGHLGEKLGLPGTHEEVESIWEKKILDRVHPSDMAEKIAWELQFLSFVKQQPTHQRTNYYLQHCLRIKNSEGSYVSLRHRIFYLDYDAQGNVLLALCLYTAAALNPGPAGIVHSLDDTLVNAPKACTLGILSERECGVLSRIGQGMASKQIADALCISVNTVNNHRQNIIRKLHCQNTTEAIGVARRLGYLGEE